MMMQLVSEEKNLSPPNMVWLGSATNMSTLMITGVKVLFKEIVLTPRGTELILKFGPLVSASQNRKLTSLSDYANEIFEM